jgi:hypothetical protein
VGDSQTSRGLSALIMPGNQEKFYTCLQFRSQIR